MYLVGQMESNFIFFLLASKVIFVCRSDLSSFRNTNIILRMSFHMLFKNNTVIERNAKIVVFSPPSFHLFSQTK